jgi:hypothetical protein
MRSDARKRARGSTFWTRFLSVMAGVVRTGKPSLDSSTTSYGSLRSSVGLGGAVAPRIAPCLSPCGDASLNSNAMTQLLHGWSTMTLGSNTAFGVFASGFVGGRHDLIKGRCRDMLPLPVARAEMFDHWAPLVDITLALRLLNLSIAGLNFLYFNGRVGPVPPRASCLHTAVITRLRNKLDFALAELITVERVVAVPGSLERLTGDAHVSKFPPLRADDVDHLPISGQVDPLPYMPSEVRELLSSPGLLFPKGTGHIPGRRTCREEHHGDRVTLTLRLLRCGKLSLARHASASADTFVVGKHGGNRLREIWNGSLLTAAAVPSLKPPLQACPASLATLEASDDRPQHVSCRDGKVFFDQLAAPASLRAFLGRPLVSVADLMNPPVCESGALSAAGLTANELEDLLQDGPLEASDAFLVPLNNTWPMGFGWSSYVAQTTMVRACMNAGFHADQMLSSERALSSCINECVAIATDDVNLFQRLAPCERSEICSAPLSVLNAAWAAMGIEGHAGKAVDLALDAKVLGVQLRGGIRLQSRGERIWSLLEASLDVGNIGVATPLKIAGLIGHIHWQDLLNRPLYSCLHTVYSFVRLQPEHGQRLVPLSVQSELLHNIALFPYWSADLRRPWWAFVAATDASPSYGYGMSLSKCSPALTRSVGMAAADSSLVVRLETHPGDPVEVDRIGVEMRLPMCLDDFHTIFAIKAKEISHSGAMEMEGVKLAVLRLCRNRRLHGHRGVVLVDAQAVGFALRKGRSSAGTLRPGTCAIAALSLAADLRLVFPYLPSESNPADYPSRNKLKVRTKFRKPRTVRRCAAELLERHSRRAQRAWRQPGSAAF